MSGHPLMYGPPCILRARQHSKLFRYFKIRSTILFSVGINLTHNLCAAKWAKFHSIFSWCAIQKTPCAFAVLTLPSVCVEVDQLVNRLFHFNSAPSTVS